MLVGAGGEPANSRSGLMVRARSGFAKRLLVALAIKTRLAGSVEYRREHTFAELRKQRLDIQLALDSRRELIPLFRGARILQVINGAAIGPSTPQLATPEPHYLQS